MYRIVMGFYRPLVFGILVCVPAAAQFLQQGLKLTGTGGGEGSSQGWSVAMSADGNTILEGGIGDNNNAGAAWVFARSGAAWAPQGSKLIPTNPQGASKVGTCVALSSDGNTALLGGNADNGGNGAVWVFTRSGSVWTQQAELLPSGGSGAGVGASCSLAGDGNTAIAGGPTAGNGAAWIFTRAGTTWTQAAKLTPRDAIGTAQFGYSAALSSDGSTALVGGIGANSNVGAAWVFTGSGGVWTQQGNKLVGNVPSGSTSNEGHAVALSADGNTAAIGGQKDNGNIGAAWIFTRSAGAWTQQGNKLVGSGADGNAQQGFSVALTADGNTLVEGGPNENGGLGVGAVWVFQRSAGAWAQVGSKVVGTGYQFSNLSGFVVGPSEGTSVAISGDGATLAFGGWVDVNLTGAVWVFAQPHFTFSMPVTATAGTPINFIVSALDPNNLLIPAYAGTLHFTSSDAAAVLPADSTLTAGTRNLSATFQTGGSQTITATDSANAAAKGKSSAVAVTASVTAGTALPMAVSPAGGISNQPVTFVFSDSAGYKDLNVVDMLVNNFLDGRRACYLAYIVAQQTLILVDDGGDAGGPYAGSVALGSSAAITNGQCSASLVSAVGNGNTLTLVLNVSWNAAFAGDKVFYMAASNSAQASSGWYPLGVVRVTGGSSTITAVGGVNPFGGAGAIAGPFQFTYSDTKGYTDLGVENILVNDDLDGRHACYIAVSRPFNQLFLVDDVGGNLSPAQSLTSAGSVSNSQCTVSWAAAPISGTGNTLTLLLTLAFSHSFSGNRIIYLATRDVNETNSTDWHAMGTWTVP